MAKVVLEPILARGFLDQTRDGLGVAPDCRRAAFAASARVRRSGRWFSAAAGAANIQDPDDIAGSSVRFAGLRKSYADAACRRPRFRADLDRLRPHRQVEIVKRDDAGTFVLLPRRWRVVRSPGWFHRCRRLAKEWERPNRSAKAFLPWASVRIMLRNLCQKTP